MWNWLKTKFKKPVITKPLLVIKNQLTKEEKLKTILNSYKAGKITLAQTIDLIYIWKLRK